LPKVDQTAGYMLKSFFIIALFIVN